MYFEKWRMKGEPSSGVLPVFHDVRCCPCVYVVLLYERRQKCIVYWWVI